MFKLLQNINVGRWCERTEQPDAWRSGSPGDRGRLRSKRTADSVGGSRAGVCVLPQILHSASNPAELLRLTPWPTPLKLLCVGYHTPRSHTPTHPQAQFQALTRSMRHREQRVTRNSLRIESGTKNAGKKRGDDADDGGVVQDAAPGKRAHQRSVRCSCGVNIAQKRDAFRFDKSCACLSCGRGTFEDGIGLDLQNTQLIRQIQ